MVRDWRDDLLVAVWEDGNDLRRACIVDREFDVFASLPDISQRRQSTSDDRRILIFQHPIKSVDEIRCLYKSLVVIIELGNHNGGSLADVGVTIVHELLEWNNSVFDKFFDVNVGDCSKSRALIRGFESCISYASVSLEGRLHLKGRSPLGELAELEVQCPASGERSSVGRGSTWVWQLAVGRGVSVTVLTFS